MKKIRTSIELKPGQSNKLQAIAAKLGYLQTRGAGTGKVGSIAQLMQALAEDEIRASKLDQDILNFAKNLALALQDEVSHHGPEFCTENSLNLLDEARKKLNIVEDLEEIKIAGGRHRPRLWPAR